MRILMVSNLYPPHHHGGYELRCSQIAEALRSRGHDVRVVTSSHRVGSGQRTEPDVAGAVPVERFLRHHRLDPLPESMISNLSLIRDQLKDAIRFSQMLDSFRPQIVNWWNLEGVTKSILPMPAARGIPDAFTVDDNWVIHELGPSGSREHPFWGEFWRVRWWPQSVRPLLRRLVGPWESSVRRRGVPTGPGSYRLGHGIFISDFRKYQHDQEPGLSFASSEVIYGGIPPERFYVRRAPREFEAKPLRLLYAGYVDPKRGLHTVIEALALLSPHQRDRIELSIASTGTAPPGTYLKSVKDRIDQLGLSKKVHFLGRVSHADMPGVYAGHHVLVFPSTLNEGLPMTMMEAMCAGCAVITTGSGGAAELAERAGLPLFPKDHPFALSQLISRLEACRPRIDAIARRGQVVVLSEFTFDRMIDQSERALECVAGVRGHRQAVDDPAGQPSCQPSLERASEAVAHGS